MIPLTASDILQSARDIYAAAPSHAPYGAPFPDDEHCILTAVDLAAHGEGNYSEVVDRLIMAAGTDDLIDFNAKHSTAEVLAAFDRAIEATV